MLLDHDFFNRKTEKVAKISMTPSEFAERFLYIDRGTRFKIGSERKYYDRSTICPCHIKSSSPPGKPKKALPRATSSVVNSFIIITILQPMPQPKSARSRNFRTGK